VGGPLESLVTAFQTALADRIAALETLRGRPFEAGSVAAGEVRRMAHALRGVGGTFGFPEVSEAAGACEDAPADALPARLDGLLAVLRRVAASPRPAERMVLLVEDDIAVSALVQMALTAPGRRIFAVQTTAAAQMVLEDHQPDLILLDLVLPDADGRSLLRKLRAGERTAQVPIVVISALTSEAVREECLAAGADQYLTKPVDTSRLRAVVAALFDAPRVPAAQPGGHARPPASLPGTAGAPAAAPETPAVAPLGPALRGPILLAEDDELMAAVVLHRLTREGLDVRRHADGAAALAAALAEPHALLILDVKMPAMDGFELLQRLRALPAYRSTPILMLTSMGDERDIARGLELGADDYIVKPFSPVELVARVRRHLRR